MMQATRERPDTQRRWSRWYPKKHDDLVIERWAQACSKINNDCRGCEFQDDCQDLADRLIGCMNVQSPASYKRKRALSLNRTIHSQKKTMSKRLDEKRGAPGMVKSVVEDSLDVHLEYQL